ncbi:MAG: DUF6785 family protein [Phycisphaerae bacterium]
MTLRSVVLGLLGVIFICGLTPYNDYALGNTFLVGNFLPVGLVFLLLVLVLVVNVPLLKFLPKRAFTSGEIAVATAMTLVACALPSSGLMRYFPAMTVGIHQEAATSSKALRVLEEVDLPEWILPASDADSLQEYVRSGVIREYFNRADQATGLAAVPWEAWVQPLLTWGIFFGSFFAGLLFLAMIVRRQWVQNERLPFPLAGVYLSLIEQPTGRNLLNSVLRARSFWIAAVAVVIVHSFNGLNLYLTKWPSIPVGYNFNTIFANPPWSYTQWSFKTATLYFSLVGITLFLQTKLAFSLWFFFILVQIASVISKTYGSGITPIMQNDQGFGALLALSVAVIFIGRAHWWMVMRHMFTVRRPEDSEGRYLPYWFCGWGVVVCFVGMMVWLSLVGVSVAGAFVIVLMMFTIAMMIARVVAETGLIFVQLPIPYDRLFDLLGGIPATPEDKVVTTAFMSRWVNHMATHDGREIFSVFSTHALRVADETIYARNETWRRAVPFVLTLVLALGVGYVVSAGSTLTVEYNYGAMLDQQGNAPLNYYGVVSTPRTTINTAHHYMPGVSAPAESHSRWLHFTGGAAFTAFLSFMRLRLAWWPFHPIGFLLVATYPMAKIWFSIFIGWFAKVLITRFGGASMLRAAKPFFIGLIVGEAAAAALWLIVSLTLHLLGYGYTAVNLLPA